MRAAYRMLHTVGPIKLWLWRRLLIGITLQLELSAHHTLDGCVLGFGLFPRKPFSVCGSPLTIWVPFFSILITIGQFRNSCDVLVLICFVVHLNLCILKVSN